MSISHATAGPVCGWSISAADAADNVSQRDDAREFDVQLVEERMAITIKSAAVAFWQKTV